MVRGKGEPDLNHMMGLLPFIISSVMFTVF